MPIAADPPLDSAEPLAVVRTRLSDGGARPAIFSEPVRTITPSLPFDAISPMRFTLESEIATAGTTVTPVEPAPA